MKVYLQSVARGCVSSHLELSMYRRVIEQFGHESTEYSHEADVIVLNTCGFSTDREKEAIDVLLDYQKKFPQKKVILGGCLPEINEKSYAGIYDEKVFRPEKFNEFIDALQLAPDNSAPIDIAAIMKDVNHIEPQDLLNLNWKFKIFYYARKMYNYFNKYFPFHNIYWDNFFKSITLNSDNFLIVASRGCLGKCTYCSIPKAKGTLVSTTLKDIQDSIDLALSKGFTNIAFSAEDMGPWGNDFGSNIGELLDSLQARKDKFTIKLAYLEPSYFCKYFDKIINPLSDRRMMSTYIPIHSGAHKIIRRMGRNYSPKEVIIKVRELKKSNPHIVIKTNILHSFPGERWIDFLKSIYYAIHFDVAFSLTFTPRPDTPAALFPLQINPKTKVLRNLIANAIFAISNIYHLAINFCRSAIDSMNRPAMTRPDWSPFR